MNSSYWFKLAILSSLFVTSFGGCSFPPDWTGRWFQSGVGHFSINSTHFGKDECDQKDGDKYVISDRLDKDNYKRCIAVNKRHDNVIQYKESLYYPLDSLDDVCNEITGDQQLLSLIRVDGGATPVPCPLKAPPFQFSYSRGQGECASPPSSITGCTDGSRLLVNYAACPDTGTESGVEELTCLATWRESSSFYLIVKIHRKNLMLSEEESYRCFMYNEKGGGKIAYRVAQSADATCNTVTSPTEGSRTMTLTRVETSYERCRFPEWVVEHRHWHSLNGSRSYHFSHRNVSLRERDPAASDMRLVCHLVVANSSAANITIIAHATRGCENGYICMVFHKRANGVIQLQQSGDMANQDFEACRPPYTDSFQKTGPVTLITASQPAAACPLSGRYVGVGDSSAVDGAPCAANASLSIGCGDSPRIATVRSCSADSDTVYRCHGSWTEDGTTYVIATVGGSQSAESGGRGTEARRRCLRLRRSGPRLELTWSADECGPDPIATAAASPPIALTLQGSCEEWYAARDSSNSHLPPRLPLLAALSLLYLRLR